MSAWQRFRARLLVVALVVGAPLAIAAQAPATQQGVSTFASVAGSLQSISDLYRGGDGNPITFDANAAAQRGLPQESIDLAQELAAYTNALLAATGEALTQTVDVTTVDVDMQKFPRVAEFLDEATNHSNELPLDPQQEAEPQIPEGVQPAGLLAEYFCGGFLRPRPSRGAPWRQWISGNAPAVLATWGYHRTPSWAGGGWTRPQTHMAWMCGWNTYRDHAYIVDSTHFREQNYAGWTPRGEPNPEVWRSGPWPYLTWPAYVRWWHSRY